MKTGNGAAPNPKGIFQGAFKKENSNIISDTTSRSFTAKKDTLKKGQRGGPAKTGK